MFTRILIREYNKKFGFKAVAKEYIDCLSILYSVLILILTYLLSLFIERHNYLMIFLFLIFEISVFLIFIFHK